MTLLAIGLASWSLLHLFPALGAPARDQLVARLGTASWRGLFSLGIVASLVMIVLGWRSTPPRLLYAPPLTPGPVVAAAVWVAFVLFVAAQAKTNIKRWLRHPQLTGVIVWGVAHLLANGDQRAAALFGTMAVWAAVEIVAINRRDGPRAAPAPVSPALDLAVVAIATLAYGAVLYFHASLFGVTALGR